MRPEGRSEGGGVEARAGGDGEGDEGEGARGGRGHHPAEEVQERGEGEWCQVQHAVVGRERRRDWDPFPPRGWCSLL